MTDEFDDLFVEEGHLDKKVLKEMLNGKIRLTPSREVVFISKETSRTKVLLFLLAHKVFRSKGMLSEEAVGGNEIHQGTGMPLGTIYPLLRQMEKAGLVKNVEGKYHVPGYALSKVEETLEKKRKKRDEVKSDE